MSKNASTSLAGLLARNAAAADFSQLELLFVVPGGGPGDDVAGFPPWTRERAAAAVGAWRHERRCRPRRARAPACAFLALSCGSLNAPSARLADGRASFESMATARFLEESGVPPAAVIAESYSWDTAASRAAAHVCTSIKRGRSGHEGGHAAAPTCCR